MRRLVSTLALLASMAPVADALQQRGADEPKYGRISIEGKDYGYVLASAIWTFPKGGEKIIFVCWENPATEYSSQMRWVKESVLDTWGRLSALSFRGWEACVPRSTGIRIRIADEGPHVKRLGRYLDGMKDGMVLNFTYLNWSPSCRQDSEYCTRTIAVHEFGHALAFAHEQNRFDAPGECQAQSQGTGGDVLLTPYDPESVMNYCNQKYNNHGRLSAMDVASVQKLYCGPENQHCEPQY